MEANSRVTLQIRYLMVFANIEAEMESTSKVTLTMVCVADKVTFVYPMVTLMKVSSEITSAMVRVR